MIKFQLVSPHGQITHEKVTSVYAESLNGLFGILTDHQPIITILKDNSLLKIYDEENSTEIKYSIGKSAILKFADNEAVVLAQNFTEIQDY